jgi:hypothetical protein
MPTAQKKEEDMRIEIMKTHWLAASAFALVAMVSCTEESMDDAPEPGEAPVATESNDTTIERESAMESETDLADIVAAPATFAGRQVTVVADLEEVLGPRAFTLDEDAPLQAGIDNDLLVLGTATGGLAAIDDQWLDNRVRVTGTVQSWSVVEMEREIGWDLDEELELELEDRQAVLIASSVERVEEEP